MIVVIYSKRNSILYFFISYKIIDKMTGCDGCDSNTNTKNIEYITPDMWNLYNVKQNTRIPPGSMFKPKFHTTYVGHTRAHYPRADLEYRRANNYNTETGKRCATCNAGCAAGVPKEQFGITKNMAYAQGIVKHPECIPGPASTGRCEIVCDGCVGGVPKEQFGITKNMAYAQGIVKHPECIAGPASTGRCEIVCDTISQVKHKHYITKRDSNYIGSSKKMSYGRYMRTTPGMETFASKKVESLQDTVTKNVDNWVNCWCPEGSTCKTV